jgi:apolipoprotein N-acyltransferase
LTDRAPAARPILPLWAAVLVVLAAGPVMDAAYPDRGYWPLAFIGIATVLIALVGRRFWSAALVGFIFGMSYYLVHIEWASVFLGPIPMTALSFVMAAYIALGSGLIALAYRWMPRAWPGAVGRLVVLPIAIAALWMARESIESTWPYGGFAWGRMGQSQVDSPLATLYAWIGISGVTFVMVWLVALVVEVLRHRGLPPLQRAIAPVGLALALVVWPAWPVPETGSFRVAVVQGNGKAGYFDQRNAGDLLLAQYEATQPLVGTSPPVDLVLWPEGSSDWDPQIEPYAANVWDVVSEQMDAPLLAQAVTVRDDLAYNTAMLWEAGVGVLDTYDKRHPVPMGEYVPDRWFFRQLAPDLIDMIGRDYQPGTTNAVMDIPLRSGGHVRAAVNICYDIVDDGLLRESIVDGGQVILASSNNADFGFTDESRQQLAFARIRAMELGRSVVNASTVGITAVIAPDGTVVQSLPWYSQGTIIADVPLSDTITPDAVAGYQIEWGIGALGFALLIGAGVSVPVRRKR